MTDSSRYSEYGRHGRLPRQKRFKTLARAGADNGVWYNCWNCGFMNKVNRTSVGQGAGTGGITYTIEPEANVPKEGEQRTRIGLRGIFILQKTNFSEKHNIVPTVGSGCPFCGSLNTR